MKTAICFFATFYTLFAQNDSLVKYYSTEIIRSNIIKGRPEIEVDVNKGTMNLKVDDDTIKKRLENYSPIIPEIKGGYQKMYVEHVMQADKGADLDFLIGKRGAEVKRHSH